MSEQPVIKTMIGGVEYEVTQSARLQAAINMREREDVKARVVAMLGEDEGRRRYPEAWWTDEQWKAYSDALASTT